MSAIFEFVIASSFIFAVVIALSAKSSVAIEAFTIFAEFTESVSSLIRVTEPSASFAVRIAPSARSDEEIVPSVISVDSIVVPRVVCRELLFSVRPVPVKSVIVSLLTLIPAENVASPVVDRVDDSVVAPVIPNVPAIDVFPFASVVRFDVSTQAVPFHLSVLFVDVPADGE